MAWRRLIARLLLASGVCAAPALAAPGVIVAAGDTRRLAPYRDAVTMERPPASARERAPSPGGPPHARLDKTWLLPIRTPEMAPGRIDPRSPAPALEGRLVRLERPLFLVGADARSLAWLARYRARLQALGAVGMLVEADSAEALAAVERAGAGLVIVPASASLLAHRLGLRHYPVLLSRAGLEQ